ncbi:MAG: T9SS type A sorting domain-containing protein [Candidatus Delongbacteria bacterium]|nr:T9SS type A sorting domain-containing protein [Candidatus Delongbacteria bacterium]
MNDVINNLTEKDFYAVGAATNLYNYADLKIFRDVNSLDYNLSAFSELGRFYDYFSGQFVFIGKDNRIVGILNSSAEKTMIEEKIKEAMATFYGIRSKEHPNYYFLDNDQEMIKLSDLFYYQNINEVEFNITGSTDESVCDYEISGDEIYLSRGSKPGHTDMTVSIGVKDKDIQIRTEISVINSQHYELEDFEYGSLSGSPLNWIADSGGWETDLTNSYSGKMSLKSGKIDHSMSSALKINITLDTESAISFAYKTDSYYEYYLDEIDGDFLNFYMNGVNVTLRESRELWGGNNDWRMVSFQLARGDYELMWEYNKNEWGASDNDAVWIDFAVLPDNLSSAVSGGLIPESHDLKISPNPFNPETEVSFKLDQKEHVKLNLYDLKGREIMEIINEEMGSGRHSFIISPSDLAGGTYFMVLKAGNNTQAKKIVFLK